MEQGAGVRAEGEAAVEDKAAAGTESEVETEVTTEAEVEIEASTEAEIGEAAAAGTESEAEAEAEAEPTSSALAVAEIPPGADMPAGAVNPNSQPPVRRRGWFVTGWLASALAVGTGAGFGILAVIGASDEYVMAGVPVAPATTPSAKVTSGVRPDGTHYGSVKDFLLPLPDGFQTGPDEGGLGNDSTIPPDQADPTVALLFGTLPASDMTSAQGAIATGHMKDGAVRTYANAAGTLDVAVTVLRLDPAQAAESTSEFERVVRQSRAYRNGPQVLSHPEALCVLPVTHVGDPLDSMTCLATVGDTLAIVNAEGTVPLNANDVTELFGRQLDTLKGGLGT
jgi:hypothetical protein